MNFILKLTKFKMLNLDEFEVHDDAFSFEDSISIIKLFNKFKNQHSYFKRSELPYSTPFEYMIDDYLNKIGDTTEMVEYWYRSKWINIGCHQDLNEYLFKSNSEVINPEHGHIMYLSAANNEAGTVLFGNNFASIIYPKIGRIVRFKGNVFHYIPNPLSYMFGDNNENESTINRHVLLFNTWNSYVPGPKETKIRCKINRIPRFNPIENWVKLPIFDIIPLRNEEFRIRVKFMGDSKRRFGKENVEYYCVNSRFKTDGYHQRLICYEIKK